MPTLYTSLIGNAPMFVHFFARLAGIDLDTQVVSIPNREHKQPEYLAIAPSGQVPALRDGDVSVWESPAIVRYLAAKHRSALYPLHDPVALARVDSAFSWLWFNAWDHERDVAVQTFLIARIRGGIADPAKVEEATAALNRDFAFIEENFFLESPTVVVGKELTVCDALLATLLWHGTAAAGIELDLVATPRLAVYWDAMQAREDFKATFEASNAILAKMTG